MKLHHPLSGVDVEVSDDAVVKALIAQRDVLAAGLRGMAKIADDYFTELHDDGHGGVNEPDEADRVCHVWNAAGTVLENPGALQTSLYAEFTPREDEEAEIALISAGRVLAALGETQPQQGGFET